MTEDGKKLPYMPALRQALKSARTLDQALEAMDGVRAFREVWSFLIDKLKGAIPMDSETPGAFRPEFALSVLNDLEEVVRTIDKDLESVRSMPVGWLQILPDSITSGMDLPQGDEFPSKRGE